MKKILFIFIMFVYGIGLSSIHAVEFKDCIQYQGYWTEWALVRLDIRGGYNGMTFRPMNSDPWLYYLGFTIDNFAFPTKQEIKAHKKENREYFYTGTCEYYVCDEYPTITSILKKFKRPIPIHPEKTMKYRNVRKVTEKVTIVIAPFENVPEVYTIVFSEAKYAFWFPNGIYFN